MKSKTLSDLEATTNKNCVRCKPKASCLLHEGYGMAIEDVRAMLMEKVKELEYIIKHDKNGDILADEMEPVIDELLRIAGKVKA